MHKSQSINWCDCSYTLSELSLPGSLVGDASLLDSLANSIDSFVGSLATDVSWTLTIFNNHLTMSPPLVKAPKLGSNKFSKDRIFCLPTSNGIYNKGKYI